MQDPIDGDRYCNNTLVYINPYDQRENDDGKHADPAKNMSGGELSLWRSVADASEDEQHAAKDALVQFLKGNEYVRHRRLAVLVLRKLNAQNALATSFQRWKEEAAAAVIARQTATVTYEPMGNSLVDQLFEGLVIKP